jgi:replicative DNA helicase
MMIEEGYNEGSDPFELQTVVINELEKHQAHTSREPEPLLKIATETIAEIASIQQSGSHVTGIDTFFRAINRVLHGWHKSDLIILAARPAAGKTALCLNFANNVAKQNIPVAIFSLEMSSRQLVTRLISSETGVSGEKLKTADLQEHHWRSIHGGDFKLPMYIDDTPGLSLIEFKMKARKLKRKHKIQMVVVDYLQLMSAHEKGQNREGEISKISRGLKHIAKELDIPVIALAQLSRDVEKNNRQPKLSDLRESGAIEQDADIVIFLDDPEAEQNLRDGNLCPIIDVIIAKHRNGAVGLAKLQFDKTISKFKDLEQ